MFDPFSGIFEFNRAPYFVSLPDTGGATTYRSIAQASVETTGVVSVSRPRTSTSGATVSSIGAASRMMNRTSSAGALVGAEGIDFATRPRTSLAAASVTTAGAASVSGTYDLLDSTVFDLDATNADSYDGSSQTWNNLTATPADSSNPADNNFYLGTGSGTDSADPSFVGTAGDQAAHFVLTAGTKFSQISSNSAFFRDLHKSNTMDEFWIAAVMKLDTGMKLLNTHVTFEPSGVYLWGNGTRLYMYTYGDSENFLTGSYNEFSPELGTTDYRAIVFSVKKSTGQKRLWAGHSALDEKTYTHPTATGDTPMLGELFPDTNSDVGNVVAMSAGTEFLDETKAQSILSAYRTRHGRTY